MDVTEQRRLILEKVEHGELDIDQASVLLAALEDGAGAENHDDFGPETVVDVDPQSGEAHLDEPEKINAPGCWRVVWFLPLVIGVVLTGFGAWWMYRGWMEKPLGWGFWLSWLPFLLGVGLVAVGWILESAPWLILDIRSKEKEGKRKPIFVFAMPAPFGLISWLFRSFPGIIPAKYRERGMVEMLDEFNNSIKQGDPMMIDVNDDDDGEDERVRIYIGKR